MNKIIMEKKKTKKKKGGKLRALLLVFISLVLGVSLYIWNAHNLTGNAMPMPFGWGMSVVLTGSMEPELSADDLVVVHRSDVYSVGDIVVFQHENELIIHRIIEADGETFITQGDANNTEDPPINEKDIKGRLVFSVPYLGAVINAVRTPLGTIIILALAFLLLELSYRRERESDDEELEKLKEAIRELKSSDNDNNSD